MSRPHVALVTAALLLCALPVPAQITPDSPGKPATPSAGSAMTVASTRQQLDAIMTRVNKAGNDYTAAAQRLKETHKAQVTAFLATRDAERQIIESSAAEQIRQYKAQQILEPARVDGKREAPAQLLNLPATLASFEANTSAGLQKIQATQAQEDVALKAQYDKSTSAAATLALEDVRKLQAQATRQNPPGLQDIQALLGSYANSLQVLLQKINNP